MSTILERINQRRQAGGQTALVSPTSTSGSIIDRINQRRGEDGVSLVGVPGYKKAALLLIDKFVHTEMLKTRASTYLEVMVSGILSGIEHPFIVNLVR